MTTETSPPGGQTEPTMCARHPDVETELACGRCETPICPRCLVYTPAGTRCPACAAVGRPRMYTMGVLDYARAIATAIVVAPLLGLVGALLFRPTSAIGLFSLLFGVLGGYGAGIVVARTLDLTTGRKRGREITFVAGGAIILAALARFVIVGVPLELVIRDVSGLLMVVIGISVASSRLR